MNIETHPPALPMPNDDFDGNTVIASCWLVDAYGHDAEAHGEDGFYRADVLLLRRNTDGFGYYVLAHISCELGHNYWSYESAHLFENIVPAVEAYVERTQ